MTPREFDAVAQLARESLIWRVAQWTAGSFGAAARSSRIAGRLREWTADTQTWSIETKLRCAALTVAWTGVGFAIGRALLPTYVVSGLPLPWIGVVILFALGIAARPAAFIAGWRERLRSFN